MSTVAFIEHFINEDINEDIDDWWNRRQFLEEDILNGNYDEWPTEVASISGCDYEDELVDQLAKLPPAGDVVELTSSLRVSALREFSAEVVNGTTEVSQGSLRINRDVRRASPNGARIRSWCQQERHQVLEEAPGPAEQMGRHR